MPAVAVLSADHTVDEGATSRSLPSPPAWPTDLARKQITKPPVLLVHGTADSVVPVAALHDAESQLKRLGVEVKTHISHGLGHSVDPIGLRKGRDFVAEALN